jgi:hypothetical protein
MTVASLRAIRRACLVSLYAVAVAQGVHVAFRAEPSRADLLFAVVFPLLVVFAVVADSKIVRRQLPSIAPFLMLFSWSVAVPGYLVWTRGWRGLALVVAFAVTVSLAYYVTAIAAYNFGWLVSPPV